MPSAKSPLLPAWLLPCIVAALATGCSQPKQYETFSILHVRKGPAVLYDVNSELISLAGQKALIKSSYVINAALALDVTTADGKKQRVSEQPWINSRAASETAVEWLADQIEVRSIGSPADKELGDVLMIGMKGDDPAQLDVLVNAVTEAYLARVAGEEKRLLESKRNLLEQHYFAKSQDVAKKRELVYKLAHRVGDDDTTTAKASQQLKQDYVTRLGTEILSRRIELLQKEEALNQYKRTHALDGKPKDGKDKVASKTTPDKSTPDKAVIAELNRLQKELELLKSVTARMESEHANVARIVEELGTSTEELERRQGDLALALETANKLGAELERYDLETRGGASRVTLMQKAPLPRTPIKKAPATGE